VSESRELSRRSRRVAWLGLELGHWNGWMSAVDVDVCGGREVGLSTFLAFQAASATEGEDATQGRVPNSTSHEVPTYISSTTT
jgi:hypothetical protein